MFYTPQEIIRISTLSPRQFWYARKKGRIPYTAGSDGRSTYDDASLEAAVRLATLKRQLQAPTPTLPQAVYDRIAAILVEAVEHEQVAS